VVVNGLLLFIALCFDDFFNYLFASEAAGAGVEAG
jgi:hypothetical protein